MIYKGALRFSTSQKSFSTQGKSLMWPYCCFDKNKPCLFFFWSECSTGKQQLTSPWPLLVIAITHQKGAVAAARIYLANMPQSWQEGTMFLGGMVSLVFTSY